MMSLPGSRSAPISDEGALEEPGAPIAPMGPEEIHDTRAKEGGKRREAQARKEGLSLQEGSAGLLKEGRRGRKSRVEGEGLSIELRANYSL